MTSENKIKIGARVGEPREGSDMIVTMYSASLVFPDGFGTLRPGLAEDSYTRVQWYKPAELMVVTMYDLGLEVWMRAVSKSVFETCKRDGLESIRKDALNTVFSAIHRSNDKEQIVKDLFNILIKRGSESGKRKLQFELRSMLGVR